MIQYTYINFFKDNVCHDSKPFYSSIFLTIYTYIWMILFWCGNLNWKLGRAEDVILGNDGVVGEEVIWIVVLVNVGSWEALFVAETKRDRNKGGTNN